MGKRERYDNHEAHVRAIEAYLRTNPDYAKTLANDYHVRNEVSDEYFKNKENNMSETKPEIVKRYQLPSYSVRRGRFALEVEDGQIELILTDGRAILDEPHQTIQILLQALKEAENQKKGRRDFGE